MTQPKNKLGFKFQKFAHFVSDKCGHPGAFIASVVMIAIWLCFGPIEKYSDTWQLIVNTSTTIITFLMVFLIQNTQNRDARAIHLKLDELIRATTDARNTMIDLQNLNDDELDAFHKDLCESKQSISEKISQVEVLKKKKTPHRK